MRRAVVREERDVTRGDIRTSWGRDQGNALRETDAHRAGSTLVTHPAVPAQRCDLRPYLVIDPETSLQPTEVSFETKQVRAPRTPNPRAETCPFCWLSSGLLFPVVPLGSPVRHVTTGLGAETPECDGGYSGVGSRRHTGWLDVEPTALSAKFASSPAGPLVRRLFVRDGPGAGLVDRPVCLSALVSVRGGIRTLGELRSLVEELVRRAAREAGGIRPAEAEPGAVVVALARSLRSLGDLHLDDVQAARPGPREPAAALRTGPATRGRHGSPARRPRRCTPAGQRPACTSRTSSPGVRPSSPAPCSSSSVSSIS
ncbi:NACHT N-terminal Helical domain 1-containing protein [Streptomyces griseoviridis]|uniref:NACHT N-terminal Helical domain 1-containing protein n=1 Tax=Streptomyces griseoviridis TaxID=45398 RepID=UPI0035709AA4